MSIPIEFLYLLENNSIQNRNLIEKFFKECEKQKLNPMPDEILYEAEDNTFSISWFKHNILLLLDNDSLEIIKYPGPQSFEFETMETCIFYLIVMLSYKVESIGNLQ